jgi:hypothetical protein
MADRTLVIVDAAMAAGFRLSKPSLSQLHQALVHLYREHPDVHVAVLSDPSLKWDVSVAEQTQFEGDIIAGAVVCAPAGALDGTAGFLSRAADKAQAAGYDVIAFTDRAIPGVALGRLRNDAGRWRWDIEGTRTLEADQIGPTLPPRRRRRSR